MRPGQVSRGRVSAALLLLLAWALPFSLSAAAAQAQVSSPEAAAAPQPRAMELALLFMPVELLEKVAVRGGVRGLLASLEIDSGAKAREASYPGISAALWAAAEPEIRRAAREKHPRYVILVASVYSSHLTPAELDSLYAFYTTPTGRKVLDHIHRAMLPNSLVEEAVRSGHMSQAGVQAAMAAEARRLIATLTAEDRAAFLAVLRRVPAAKMERLNADLVQALMQWVGQNMPELRERVHAIIGPVAEQYMKDHPLKY